MIKREASQTVVRHSFIDMHSTGVATTRAAMPLLLRVLCRQSQSVWQWPGVDIRTLTPIIRKRPFSSSTSAYGAANYAYKFPSESLRSDHGAVRPLARLPTSGIMRNILLGVFFSSPVLFKPGFAFLRAVAESQTRFLNPDSNPILRVIFKPLLYDQFCAGTNHSEIQQTRDRIKSIGYSGVVLCYGKETKISESNELHEKDSTSSKEIKRWRDGNLETLDMIGSGDWLGMKLTGAGKEVTKALMHEEEPPPEFHTALDSICEKAAAKGCRIWIDAEQQALQKSIDRWAIAFMSKYNRGGRALVYNTLQAYLKASRKTLQEQLALSRREGWTLAIKLVRGAYIDADPRQLIHDHKMDTDNSYNGIVRDLLAGTNLGFAEDKFPKDIKLVLAGHNPHSINTARDLIQSLSIQGRLKIVPDFAQLQGMGDVTGCKFLSQCEANDAENAAVSSEVIKPAMYKCLTWGSIQECMQYLFRRAVENSGGTDRIRDDLAANWSECKHRIFGGLKIKRK